MGTGTYNITGSNTLRIEYLTTSSAATSLGNLPWANFTGSGSLNIAANGGFDFVANDTALPAGFTGTLQIDSGRVQCPAAAGGGLGGTTAVVVKNGGQLGLWQGGTFTQNLTIAGTGYGEGNIEAAVRMGNTGFTTTWNGPVTLSANATVGAQGGGTGIFGGNISGSAGLTFGTTGFLNGLMVLSGTNSYSGATTVSAGTLRFAKQVSLYNNNTGSWTAANLIANSGTTMAFNVGGTGEFTSANLDLLKSVGTATEGFQSGSNLGIDTTNSAGGFTYGSSIANPNGGANVIGLNKLGTDTLTLNAGNSYTGATTVTNGFLNVGTLADGGATSNIGASTNAAANLVFAGGTLRYTGASATTDRAFTLTAASGINVDNPSTTLTFANNVAAAGNNLTLTKTGAGTLALGGSADNTSLFLAASSGTVNLAKSGPTVRAAAGITSIASGATVKLTGLGTDQIYGGSPSPNFGMNGLAGVLDLNGRPESTSNFNGTSTGVVTNSASATTVTLTVGESNATSSFAGTIQNGGGGGGTAFTKIGTGTQTLSGSNTYAGPTTLDGGILALDYASGTLDNSKLPDAAPLVLNSGTIQLTGATGAHVEHTGLVTINGAVNITRSGANFAFINLAAYKNYGGLNVATTGLASTTVPNNAAGYLDGVTFAGSQLAANDLTMGGGLGFIAAATGLAYNDFTRLESGPKVLAAPSVAGAITRLTDGTGTTAAPVTIPASTLDINTLFHTASGGSTTLDLSGGTLRLPASGSIHASAGSAALLIQNGTLTAGGVPNTPGTLMLRNGSSNTFTVGSTIANNGTGAVSLRSFGNVTVNGASNSYTGSTTVVGGTLTLGTNALATTSGYSVGDVANLGANATLKFNAGFSNNRTGVGSIGLRDISPISIANNGTGTSTLDIDSTTGNWINGQVSLDKAVVLKSAGGGIRGGFVTMSGSGAGAGNDSVIYDATGSGGDNNWNTFEPVGAYTTQPNTFAGNVRFTGGFTTIQNKAYGNAAYIDLMIPDTASVKIDAGSGINFAWGNESFDGLNDGLGGGGTITSSGGTSTNIITLGANGGSGSFSGVITSGIGIRKIGVGTQRLSGVSTYSGATTVEGGTLLLNNTSGSGTGSGTITVQAGTALGGSGSASGATTVNASGVITPGDDIGTLTLGSVNLAGTYHGQLSGVAGDRLTVTGALSITPGAMIIISTLTTPTASEYTILSYGSFIGTLPTITPPSGYTVNTATPGVVKLVSTTSGYNPWAATNAPSGTPNDDYDGDGVQNGIEWVLGGLASTRDLNRLPTVSTSGGNMVFTFVRNDAAWQSGDTTTQIEVGTTLGTWPQLFNVGIDTGSSSAGVIVTPNGTTDTVTLTVPMSPDTKKFARLKVTVTP